MILIPKLYIRSKKVIALEGTNSAIYDEDPFVMAQKIKGAGGEGIYIVDLGISNMGEGENFPIIKKIKDELGLQLFIGDSFKTIQSIDAYMAIGPTLLVLGAIAYQQPALVKEAGSKYPEKLAIQINVQSNKVTIPGWAVAPNKTYLDYLEQFLESGISSYFYSDVGNDGTLAESSIKNLFTFCKKAKSTVICTSEIKTPVDIEKLVTLGAPGLEGLVLANVLYTGKIDLMSAIELVSDLSIAPGNEPTLRDE